MPADAPALEDPRWARPLDAVSFVALDLETTGISPGFDRITEIAAVRFRLDRKGRVTPGERFQSLVDPRQPIPVTVQRLTGIDADTVAGAPTIDRVWPDLLAFLADDDEGGEATVWLAHHARSDSAFLASAARRLGTRAPAAPASCTLQMARTAFPKAPTYRLGPLVEWLDVAARDPTAHRALPDALHTRNLFSRIVANAPADSLEAIADAEIVATPLPTEYEVAVPPHLTELAPAIAAQEVVELGYRGGSKGRRARPVTPMGFYRHDGRVHLRAWCHLDDIAKGFRADRIDGFTRTGERMDARGLRHPVPAAG